VGGDRISVCARFRPEVIKDALGRGLDLESHAVLDFRWISGRLAVFSGVVLFHDRSPLHILLEDGVLIKIEKGRTSKVLPLERSDGLGVRMAGIQE
jgi:hypothetical protein